MTSQEIYMMNWYDDIVYAFPLGLVYLLITKGYQCNICHKNSAFLLCAEFNNIYREIQESSLYLLYDRQGIEFEVENGDNILA